VCVFFSRFHSPNQSHLSIYCTFLRRQRIHSNLTMSYFQPLQEGCAPHLCFSTSDFTPSKELQSQLVPSYPRPSDSQLKSYLQASESTTSLGTMKYDSLMINNEIALGLWRRNGSLKIPSETKSYCMPETALSHSIVTTNKYTAEDPPKTALFSFVDKESWTAALSLRSLSGLNNTNHLQAISKSSLHASPASHRTKTKSTKPVARKRVSRKCQIGNCANTVVQGGRCISHGAKRSKCKHPGCTKNTKKAGMCSTHGPARKKCQTLECENVAVQGGLCINHGAKKKLCSTTGCTKKAKSAYGNMCKRHFDLNRLLFKALSTSSTSGDSPVQCKTIASGAAV
jgi:hypothetical protein